MFLFLVGCPSGGGGITSGGEGLEGEESGLDAGCTASSDPGCNDCSCEECVCVIDSWCCDVEWDDLCVEACSGECGFDCGGPDPVGNASEILEHDFPESLVAGETSSGLVTVLNKGDEPWTAEEGYRLGAMGDSDPFAESVRIYLPDDVAVAPGDSWTFEIPMTAPELSGKYQTGWRMVQENVEWFGHQVVVDVMVECPEATDDELVTALDVPLCVPPPGGDACASKPYQQVWAGENATCTLDLKGEAACWGQTYSGLGEPPSGPFTQISFAYDHACAIRPDQSLACWGKDYSGEASPPAGKFQRVTVGDEISCGLRDDASIECWGDDVNEIQAVPSGTFTQVDAGRDHACALRADGLVSCWGSTGHGEANGSCELFQQIAAGGRTSCGIRLDGSLVCWGQFAEVVDPEPGDAFKAVIPGTSHVCALRLDGSLVCWGSPPTAEQKSVTSGPFQQFSGEQYHLCGLLENCSLKCWGKESHGQLDPAIHAAALVGHGIPAGMNKYKTVVSGDTVEAFVEMQNTGTSIWSEADEFRLGAYNDSDPFLVENRVKIPEGVQVCPGESWVFEFSMFGPAIPGEYTSDWKMVQEYVQWFGPVLSVDVTVLCSGLDEVGGCDAGLAGVACDQLAFTEVSGGRDHVCGILVDGSISCWGKSDAGKTAPPAGEFSAIDLGRDHACGLRGDGAVECWGVNADGESDAPSGIFQQVSAGWRFTCGVRADGSIACWGRDDYGKGTPPSGEFQSVSAGVAHGCGVDASGELSCWGKDDFGQSTGAVTTTGFVAVGAGWRHTCGLRGDGSVYCWGDNEYGQTQAPEGVFTSIAVGYTHTCAVRDDGESVCWGSNFEGEIAGVCGDYKAVAAGDKFSCGVHLGGRVDCWGKNTFGELNVPIP
jgi:alpha-tubulin suppressor-like RCC1 family protein